MHLLRAMTSRSPVKLQSMFDDMTFTNSIYSRLGYSGTQLNVHSIRQSSNTLCQSTIFLN